MKYKGLLGAGIGVAALAGFFKYGPEFIYDTAFETRLEQKSIPEIHNFVQSNNLTYQGNYIEINADKFFKGEEILSGSELIKLLNQYEDKQ